MGNKQAPGGGVPSGPAASSNCCGNLCCRDACGCCQTAPCCAARCCVVCRDLFCRDFYARPPIIRTLQPIGAMAPTVSMPMGMSQTTQTRIVQPGHVHMSHVHNPHMVGSGAVMGPSYYGGAPVPGHIHVGPVMRTSSVGGTIVNTGPMVPMDPKIPMVRTDTY